MQVTTTFCRNGCQNQPRLLRRACFEKLSVRTCQKLAWRRLLLTPTRFYAMPQSQTQVVKKQFDWYFSPSEWPASLPDLNPLYCLVIHFGHTQLHKTQTFGQIQNPRDQDSGRNAITIVCLKKYYCFIFFFFNWLEEIEFILSPLKVAYCTFQF
jgi:hypothetical protein